MKNQDKTHLKLKMITNKFILNDVSKLSGGFLVYKNIAEDIFAQLLIRKNKMQSRKTKKLFMKIFKHVATSISNTVNFEVNRDR